MTFFIKPAHIILEESSHKETIAVKGLSGAFALLDVAAIDVAALAPIPSSVLSLMMETFSHKLLLARWMFSWRWNIKQRFKNKQIQSRVISKCPPHTSPLH